MDDGQIKHAEEEIKLICHYSRVPGTIQIYRILLEFCTLFTVSFRPARLALDSLIC